MGRAAADRARCVVVGTRGDAAGGIDVVGAQPDAALGIVAVHSLGDGGRPLASAGLESVAEIGLDAGVDGGEGDLVKTTLGRPLLFVLEGVCNQASEAIAAVAMAGGLDHGLWQEIVEAGNTFPE